MLSFNITCAGEIIHITYFQWCQLTSKGRVVFQEVSLGKENKPENLVWKLWLVEPHRLIQKIKADFNEYLMLLKKEGLVISTLLLGPKNLVFYIPLLFSTHTSFWRLNLSYITIRQRVLQGCSSTLEVRSRFLKQWCEEIKHDLKQERTILYR